MYCKGYDTAVVITYKKPLSYIVKDLQKRFGIIMLKDIFNKKPYSANYIGNGYLMKVRQSKKDCKVYIERRGQ